MKKYFLQLIVSLMLISGCEEDRILTYEEQLEKDTKLIDEYLADNNIVAKIDDSGLRYVIIELGTGKGASLNSHIKVNYDGWLLNEDEPFESNYEGTTGSLPFFIAGWQRGIPKIREGGIIMLYIPSVLGYGSKGSGNKVPKYANLVFRVELLEVN